LVTPPYRENLAATFKKLLETFEFKAVSNKAGKSLSEVLKLLKELNEQKGGRIPVGAPKAFVKPRWQDFVFKSDGTIDCYYYEFCALVRLRDALKNGDIWVESSLQFRPLEAPVPHWGWGEAPPL